MLRSSNGVKLLSSHLIRDSCKSIYEGVFNRTLDSGVWTLSRVIRGGGGVGLLGVINLNNRMLSNTSIRGSASLSKPDYETYSFHDGPWNYGGLLPLSHKEIIDHIRKYGYGEEAQERMMEKLRQDDFSHSDIPHSDIPRSDIPHSDIPHRVPGMPFTFYFRDNIILDEIDEMEKKWRCIDEVDSSLPT